MFLLVHFSNSKSKAVLLFLLVFLNELQLSCSWQTAVHCPFEMYDIFIYFRAGVHQLLIFKIRPNILIGLQKLQLRPKDWSRSRLFIIFAVSRTGTALWDRPNIELQCQSVYIKLQNPSKISCKSVMHLVLMNFWWIFDEFWWILEFCVNTLAQ